MYRDSSSRRQLTRRALLWGSLSIGSSAVFLTACARLPALSPSQPVAQPTLTMGPRPGGVLRVGQTTDILPRVVPHVQVPANYALYPLVYDTLLAYDTQLRPQPKLATSWQWSADGRQITLQLRPGVTFHSGRAFTSADAKANLEHLRDPSVGSQWMSYANQMQIDASDPTRLVITFDAPSKSSLDALASTFIADPSTLDSTSFTGTGPFRFQEWVQGDHLTFVRNPQYWQPGKPYVDQVELLVKPDLQTSVVGLESSSLDWVTNVAGEVAHRLQPDPMYQVLLTGNGGNTYYVVGLDASAPALADKRVRQAFAYAVNRQRMVDSALSGYGRPASIVWPQQALGYDTAQDQTYSYDLSRARQLLDAAGWDPSASVTLAVVSELPATLSMAEIYQSDLQQVGVNAVVRQTSSAEALALLQKRQLGGAWISPTGLMNLQPATFFTGNLFARVPNPSNFTSDHYTSLIAQAVAATDGQQLKSIVHDLTQVMLDEAFMIPIAQAQGLGVARSTVKDIAWNSSGMYAFEDVWLDR